MLVKFCKKALWVLLVIAVLFQGIAIYGIVNGNAAERYDYRPLAVATVAMVIAVALFRVLPRGKVVPLVVAAVMGVFFVVLGVQMLGVFKASTSAGGIDIGMTFWKVLYRHMSPILIPLCMLPIFLEYREQRLYAQAEKEEMPPDSYFELLSDAQEETAKDLPRPKRSVRRRLEKAEDNRE